MRGRVVRSLPSVACALAVSLAAGTAPARQIPVADPREPFQLEVPNEPGRLVTSPEIPIPSADVSRIRVHIKNPYADAMRDSQTFTAVNGEAATFRSRIDITKTGKIVTIDLTLASGVHRLKPGQNVVEIEGTTRDDRTYYASFVLRTGGRLPPSVASFESTLATTGTDRTPPAIRVDEPKGWIPAARPAGPVTVRGSVFDDSGVVASVTVGVVAAKLRDSDGSRIVRLPSDPVPRAVKYFEAAVPVGPGDGAVVVTARDAEGNESRLSIPVVRAGSAEPGVRFSGRKFALLVGVTDYKYNVPGFSDLRFADADAQAVAAFLLTPEGGGFGRGDVQLLVNQQATLAAVRGGIASFLAKAGPDDLIYFFIAGHGVADPRSPSERYFMVHDSRVDDVPGTGLPMREVADALRDLVRAERAVVFVDTCHSGGVVDTGSRGVDNNLISLYAEVLFREKGRAVLTSSDVNELSYENEQWDGHGIFTYALLEGLKGAADVDGNRQVTAGELFAYVRNRVSVATQARQNPRVHEGNNPNLVVAALPAAKPTPASKRGGRGARR